MTDICSAARNYEGAFEARIGFGRHPALLNVDFIINYVTEDSPFYAPAAATAARQSVAVLDVARAKRIPIIHTRVVYGPTGLDGGIFIKKVPALRRLTESDPLGQIVPELAPRESEIVVRKQYASAFFATSLAPTLTSLGVDTIVLIGCTTSGCIRATAVDGMQHGFRVIVPRECVGDRHPAPHEANLFDIDRKYGDVLPLLDVLVYLNALPCPNDHKPSVPTM